MANEKKIFRVEWRQTYEYQLSYEFLASSEEEAVGRAMKFARLVQDPRDVDVEKILLPQKEAGHFQAWAAEDTTHESLARLMDGIEA